MANNIVVLGFENRYGAEAMLADVHRWQEQGLIDVEDAVLAFAEADGVVQIQETHRSESGKFALRGGGVGLVAGALLGGPILGLVAGVTAGALKGKGRDKAHGLDDDFIQAASGWVRPERSARFLLVRQADADRLGAELGPLTATVLTTTLDPERERLLRQALAQEDYVGEKGERE